MLFLCQRNGLNKVKIKSGDGIALIPRSDGTLLINPKLSKKQDELTKNTNHRLLAGYGNSRQGIYRSVSGGI